MVRSVLVAMAMVGLGACSEQPTPLQTTPKPALDLTPVLVDDAPLIPAMPITPALRARVRGLIATMGRRQKCNRIMGCEAADTLETLGPDAAPPIADAIAAMGAQAGYSLVRLLEVLARIPNPAVLESLHSLLEDRRWEVRTRATLAIAAIASARSGSVLHIRLAAVDLAKDGHGERAMAVALHYALIRCGAATLDDQRIALMALIPVGRDGVGGLNPMAMAVIVEVIGMLELRDALPSVRMAAAHRDRTARITALRVLGDMADAGGLRAVMLRVEDPNPAARRQAHQALAKITGIRRFRSAEEWIDWCSKRSCLEKDTPAAAPTPTP